MRKKFLKKGFTLIELIVAMGLFAFVAVFATSVMIAVIDGNRKTRSKVEAMDNLSFALDSITRELRVGSSYDCDGAGDCGPSGGGPGTRIDFVSSEGSNITYRFDAGILERCGSATQNCPDPTVKANYVALTGGDVVITDFDVYVQGSAPAPGDTEQPHVTIFIEGTSGSDPDTDSTFRLQTTVTQRFPDF